MTLGDLGATRGFWGNADISFRPIDLLPLLTTEVRHSIFVCSRRDRTHVYGKIEIHEFTYVIDRPPLLITMRC
jgi:hypothetical protein